MILVLLPFWTSLLVRTTAWIAMLQQQGVSERHLRLARHHRRRITVQSDLQHDRHRDRHDAYPAAVHDPADLLGDEGDPAEPCARRQEPRRDELDGVLAGLFPATIPGIGAGGLLVFILAIGYYITPRWSAVRTGSLISNFIAYHMQRR